MSAHPLPTGLAPGADLPSNGVPPEVRQALLAAAIDPERAGWSSSAHRGIALAIEAGATVLGLANDEVIELSDRRGERFGLVPLVFEPAEHPLGASEAAEPLLRALDRAFDHRPYVVAVRRPVPPDLAVAPVASAVQLWIAQVDRGAAERSATYEDAELSLDLTLLEPQKGLSGRILTFGPMEVMEQLGTVDGAIIDAASRCEESLGSLPIVAVVGASRPWRVPRGFVQQLLYGLPDEVRVDGCYEAVFTANGRSLFSDPAARAVAALWWVGPGQHRAYDNPWAAAQPGLTVPGPRFAPVGEPDRRGRVTLRW